MNKEYREIKFRLWDSLKKEMVFEGFHVFGEVTLFNAIGTYAFETKGERSSLDRYNDFEIMEWTGLKDKNKTDIYEGDIVRGNRTPDNFTGVPELGRPPYFEYREVKFEVTETSISLSLPKEGSYSERHPENNVLWEVVGNIYQNPELLNTKQ